MENSFFIPYLKENIQRAQFDNVPKAVSKFLDSNELSLACTLSKRDSSSFMFWGGYPDAERVIMIYLPDYLDTSLRFDDIFPVYADSPICAVRVKKDKFTVLSHRDYLGALMGLGLKRDTIGDICVRDDGCDIITLTSTAQYIVQNLHCAARASLKTKIIDINEIIAPELKTVDLAFTVASPRVDAVLKEIFSLSRSAAAQAISQGLVFVNDIEVTKNDRRIFPNDKIVLRKKGRAIIGDEFYKTKKGRIRITAKKSQ